jgi:hypothetical protein
VVLQQKKRGDSSNIIVAFFVALPKQKEGDDFLRYVTTNKKAMTFFVAL